MYSFSDVKLDYGEVKLKFVGFENFRSLLFENPDFIDNLTTSLTKFIASFPVIVSASRSTDIPAFYSEWFMNRIREGYVYTRNPFYYHQVIRYDLNPDVVDVLVFCSKNPKPMLKHLDELKKFRQFWFVTITPYGKDIEPNVPDKNEVLDTFIVLSKSVGKNCVSLRYDPIFISENYDEAILLYHKILEISTDTEMRNLVSRDLVYRYYTKQNIENHCT